MHLQAHITVKQICYGQGTSATYWYEVTRAVNTTAQKIGDKYDESDINNLIGLGTKVTITKANA